MDNKYFCSALVHTAVYISLDNVAIEADGHVTFHSMPDGKELDPLYLAPELQEAGFITNKVRLVLLRCMGYKALCVVSSCVCVCVCVLVCGKTTAIVLKVPD